MAKDSPTLTNGKVCYLEIPSNDVEESAVFYRTVFGWGTRRRGDGQLAFDDAGGGVSGTWVTGRQPTAEPGLLVYIMVDDIAATLETIIQQGGKVVQPVGIDAPVVTARFSDPTGNVIGLYQE